MKCFKYVTHTEDDQGTKYDDIGFSTGGITAVVPKEHDEWTYSGELHCWLTEANTEVATFMYKMGPPPALRAIGGVGGLIGIIVGVLALVLCLVLVVVAIVVVVIIIKKKRG